MDTIKLYIFVVMGTFVLSHVPQPYVSIFVAMLVLVGVQINKRDDAQHAHEKAKLKHKADTAEERASREPWYVVLGLDEHSTMEDCTKVRRLLTKIYHPDSGTMPNDKAMKRINKAFDERQLLDKAEVELLN